MTDRPGGRHARQHGAAAVEFALASAVFFMLLFGAIEMGRILFYWNTAVEATRLGARVAVVCDVNDAVVKTRMTSLFPVLTIDDIDVIYTPPGCTVGSCTEVTVRVLPGVTVDTFIPFASLALSMPGFATTLTRESMISASNPVCQ
jgi:hypothetical protein